MPIVFPNLQPSDLPNFICIYQSSYNKTTTNKTSGNIATKMPHAKKGIPYHCPGASGLVDKHRGNCRPDKKINRCKKHEDYCAAHNWVFTKNDVCRKCELAAEQEERRDENASLTTNREAQKKEVEELSAKEKKTGKHVKCQNNDCSGKKPGKPKRTSSPNSIISSSSDSEVSQTTDHIDEPVDEQNS